MESICVWLFFASVIVSAALSIQVIETLKEKYPEKYEKYFSLAKTSLDSQQASTKDPIGYANILEAYAEVLIKLGKELESKQLSSRAADIKSSFKNMESGHSATPYGKHCAKNTPRNQ